MGCFYSIGYTDMVPGNDLDFALVKWDAEGNVIWNKTWGGVNTDAAYSIWGDGTGYLYTCGLTTSFGAGGYDFALVKWDTAGNRIWNYTWGGPSNDYPDGVDSVWGDGAGAIYTVGRTASYGAGAEDFVLIKWDTAGNVDWYQTWGSASTDNGRDIWGDGTGAIYTVGETMSYGAGNVDFALVKWDEDGNVDWFDTWGGNGYDRPYGIWGDNVSAIYTSGGTNFSSGNEDFVIVKWDLEGNIIWNQTWGGTSDECAHDIWGDGCGYTYIVGGTSSFGAERSDIALIQWDASGNLIWNGTWGGSGVDCGLSLWGNDSGYVYSMGFTNSTGAGNYDFALVKWDAGADNAFSPLILEWNQTWGDNLQDGGSGLAIGENGTVFLVGTTNSYGAGGDDAFIAQYNASGSLRWNETWGGSLTDQGSAAMADSSGNAYLVGYSTSFDNGNGDAIVVKYASNGSQLWNITWGGTNSEYALAGALDSNGNIFIAGNATDAFIVKLDVNGTELWNKTWGGTGDDQGLTLAVDSNDNAYLAGTTSSFGEGNDDAFIAKYSVNGTQLWNNTWGGGGREACFGITIDNGGNSYIVGQTTSFGAGNNDAFIAKYAANGTQLWNYTWGGTRDEAARDVAIDGNGLPYVIGGTSSYGGGNVDVLIANFSLGGTLNWSGFWGKMGSEEGYNLELSDWGDLYFVGYTNSSGSGSSDAYIVKMTEIPMPPAIFTPPIYSPLNPAEFNPVNVTVRVADVNNVSRVWIMHNQSGTFQDMAMTLLSGSETDGIWNCTIPGAAGRINVSFSIWANDTQGLVKNTHWYSYLVNKTGPLNITTPTSFPEIPAPYESVNVSVRIIDADNIQLVLIQHNQTGTFQNYSMELVSGTANDGHWNYTIPGIAYGTNISYRIWANDSFGLENCTSWHSYVAIGIKPVFVPPQGHFPSNPSPNVPVNVSVRIIDPNNVSLVAIVHNQTGVFQSYPMILISGSISEGIWNYTIPGTTFGYNIWYKLWANNTLGLENSTGWYSYSVLGSGPVFGPSPTYFPKNPAPGVLVNVSIRVLDPYDIQTICLQHNQTGTIQNYSLILLSGDMSDGIWNGTIPGAPSSTQIMFRFWANDTIGAENITEWYSYVIDVTGSVNFTAPTCFPELPAPNVVVHISVRIVASNNIDNTYLQHNQTGASQYYLMDLVSGSLIDGTWNCTILGAVSGTNISYRIWANDTLGLENSTQWYSYLVIDMGFDTDADGMPNLWEVNNGLNPNDPSDNETDLDADLLINRWEYGNGTNPRLNDTDYDGLLDGSEILTYKTSPLLKDSDNDGVSDGAEVNQFKTDPNCYDTDGDGYSDGQELAWSTNPLDPNDNLFARITTIITIIANIFGAVVVKIAVYPRLKRRWGARARGDKRQQLRNIDYQKLLVIEPHTAEEAVNWIKDLEGQTNQAIAYQEYASAALLLEAKDKAYGDAIRLFQDIKMTALVPNLEEDRVKNQERFYDVKHLAWSERHNQLAEKVRNHQERAQHAEAVEVIKQVLPMLEEWARWEWEFKHPEESQKIKELAKNYEALLKTTEAVATYRQLEDQHNAIVQLVGQKKFTEALKLVPDVTNALETLKQRIQPEAATNPALASVLGPVGNLLAQVTRLPSQIEGEFKSIMQGASVPSAQPSAMSLKHMIADIHLPEAEKLAVVALRTPLHAKVVLLGESSVGKTHLVLTATGQAYSPQQGSTVGVDQYFLPVKIPVAGYDPQLCFWDLGGQWNFRSINELFLHEAAAVLIVYDITRPETFLKLQYWLDVVKQVRGPGNNQVFVVGNKLDVGGNAVPEQVITDFLHRNELARIYLTSAKNTSGVRSLVEDLASAIDWSRLIRAIDPAVAASADMALRDLRATHSIMKVVDVLDVLAKKSKADPLALQAILQQYASQNTIQFDRQRLFVLLDPEVVGKWVAKFISEAARAGGVASKEDFLKIEHLEAGQLQVIFEYLEQENVCYLLRSGSWVFPNVIHKGEPTLTDHQQAVLQSDPQSIGYKVQGPGDLIFTRLTVAIAREVGVPAFASNVAGIWDTGQGYHKAVLMLQFLPAPTGSVIRVTAGGGRGAELVTRVQDIARHVFAAYAAKVISI